MPLLKPLSRLGKTVSKYDFELTIQSLRMKENTNPSRELVYVEVARGSKRYKTNKAFVHTGDIAWDDTFQLSTTLYKAVDRETGESSFDAKEYTITFLEFNNLRSKAPRMICRCKIDMAHFVTDDGREMTTTCEMHDKNNQMMARLSVLVKARWMGDYKLQKGALGGPTRIKVSEGGQADGEGADDDSGSFSSLSTQRTRGTALSATSGQSHAESSVDGSAFAGGGGRPGGAGSAGGSAFAPRLEPIQSMGSMGELSHLVKSSPNSGKGTHAADARLIDHAVRSLPPAQRFTSLGLPVGALLIAQYATRVPSSRFTLRLCSELDAALRDGRRSLGELAYRVSFAGVLSALCWADSRSQARLLSVPAHPTAERERSVQATLGAEAQRHLQAAVELFLHRADAQLGPLLTPAFLEQTSGDPALPSGSAAAATTAAASQASGGHRSQREAVATLHSLVDELLSNGTPAPLVRHVVVQLARFCNAQLFNTLLQRRELCTSGNGVQLKLALSVLEGALEAASHRSRSEVRAPAGAPRVQRLSERSFATAQPHAGADVLDALSHIRQAADVLIVGKAVLLSGDDRAEVCPALLPDQLAHLLSMFTADEWTPEPPTAEEIDQIVESARSASDESIPRNSTSESVMLDPYAVQPIKAHQLRSAVLSWRQRGLPLGDLRDDPHFHFLEKFDMSHFLPAPSMRERGLEDDGDDLEGSDVSRSGTDPDVRTNGASQSASASLSGGVSVSVSDDFESDP